MAGSKTLQCSFEFDSESLVRVNWVGRQMREQTGSVMATSGVFKKCARKVLLSTVDPGQLAIDARATARQRIPIRTVAGEDGHALRHGEREVGEDVGRRLRRQEPRLDIPFDTSDDDPPDGAPFLRRSFPHIGGISSIRWPRHWRAGIPSVSRHP